PDGKKLAFVSSSRGWYDIGIWDIEKDSINWITKSDHEYYEPAFSNDGRKLAYLANVGGDIKLIVHDLQNKESKVIEFRHGLVSSPKFSSDDDSIYFLFSGPRNPTDVWQYRFKDEKFVQLTNSLPGDIDVSNFVDGEQIAYPCKKDGTRIPALLYMPNRSQERNAQKKLRGKGTRENLPLVIEIHGGPTAQSLNEWNPLIQALVSKGMVVLSPNYRGSTGYGKKFREANRFVMGDLDLDDCVSGRDFLLERGVIDQKRVAVTGASFGGYLTMCSLTKYPDHWTCGAALVPFLNWFTEIQNEREDLRYWDAQNMGDLQKDKERLRDASPIFFIDRIKSPVLLVAGANDPRCPLEESIQAKEELERLGKQVELVAYMDEGHGFRKMENRVDAYKKTLAFLEKHLCEKGGS
ncbi:MAG: S9 family peptidase, partial [Nitrososphaerota archaeon]|nr:S9 family peptidase [Nitrososphaerota archaeon]